MSYSTACFYAGGNVAGNYGKHGTDRHYIQLVHHDKKGKLKLEGFTVESEASF